MLSRIIIASNTHKFNTEAVLTFNPNRSLEPVQILCIVEHIACLILEDVAGYVKRIRQARCRQVNERWTGSDGNNLKQQVSGLTTDWGLTQTLETNWPTRHFDLSSTHQLVFPSTSLLINLSTRQPVYSPTWLLTYLPTRLHVYPPTKLPIYLPTYFVRFSVRILTQNPPILSTTAPHHRKNSILARVCFGAERGTAYTCRQPIKSGINMQTLPN